MRLIDADATINALNVASRGDSKDVIRNLVICFLLASPTVEAIPIEWIKKYTEENRLYQSDDFDLYISDMIADWAERKEE